jgi:hypothetical protein
MSKSSRQDTPRSSRASSSSVESKEDLHLMQEKIQQLRSGFDEPPDAQKQGDSVSDTSWSQEALRSTSDRFSSQSARFTLGGEEEGGGVSSRSDRFPSGRSESFGRQEQLGSEQRSHGGSESGGWRSDSSSRQQQPQESSLPGGGRASKLSRSSSLSEPPPLEEIGSPEGGNASRAVSGRSSSLSRIPEHTSFTDEGGRASGAPSGQLDSSSRLERSRFEPTRLTSDSEQKQGRERVTDERYRKDQSVTGKSWLSGMFRSKSPEERAQKKLDKIISKISKKSEKDFKKEEDWRKGVYTKSEQQLIEEMESREPSLSNQEILKGYEFPCYSNTPVKKKNK